MEDKLEKMEMPRLLTEEEKLEREFEKVKREKLVARSRAAVVRSQIVRAYEILENIRFDFVSDTAFRDKITRAKRSLESAVNDFLLSDAYWEKRVKEFGSMTFKDYRVYKNRPTVKWGKGKVKK